MVRPLILGASLLLPLGLLGVLSATEARGDQTPSHEQVPMPPGLAKRVQDITTTVLNHHLEPPALQQMMLEGIRRLYGVAGVARPPELSRRVSSLTTPEQFAALLKEVWPSRPANPASAAALEQALIDGILHAVSGGVGLISAKENKVREQLAGNRYVGIHIQLSYDEKEKRSVIQALVPGGPADRAGALKDDRIEAIDDVETKAMKLGEVVDRLRGESGTSLTVRVRQPGAKEARTLKMTRGPLFLPTVTGLLKSESGRWEYRGSETDGIAYMKISEISASTPHELRQCAQELQDRGRPSLILDLRGGMSTSVHPAVLLADELLDRGRIGQVREAERVVTYEAKPGALFQDWQMVVLVDEGTTGAAEWLAAALQDNHRAVIVGRMTSGGLTGRERPPRGVVVQAGIRSTIPIGQGGEEGYLELVTGRLERGDGRPLARQGVGSDERVPLEGSEHDAKVAQGGVKPDHLVPRPRGREDASRMVRSMMGANAVNIDPWTDTVLMTAVKLLSQPSASF